MAEELRREEHRSFDQVQQESVKEVVRISPDQKLRAPISLFPETGIPFPRFAFFLFSLFQKVDVSKTKTSLVFGTVFGERKRKRKKKTKKKKRGTVPICINSLESLESCMDRCLFKTPTFLPLKI